jgi:pimeloyl-ACP methyl ester carboxylesterase
MIGGFTDHYFATADGPRLHYRDYPAVGRETGVPVLCLHGLTRNVKDFEELAPMIAALGRRVIVASQRGRGLSEPDPDMERYQPLTYAADMMALLESLEIGKAVFVGTSMGGLMTMITAATRPDLIAAAVINDIGPELSEDGLNRIRENTSSREPVDSWDEAAARSRESNLEAFPRRADDPAFWDAFARRCWGEREDGKLALEYDGQIIEAMNAGGPLPDLWPFWEPFKSIPVLLVRGGITDLLTEATVAEMKRRAPDMAYVEVPGVGHAPFMTEPEAWVAIERFMGEAD